MKNFNTVLILLGILSASILIVENMVLRQQAYVFIYYSNTWVLCFASILTGMALGFWIKGKLTEAPTDAGSDSFDF